MMDLNYHSIIRMDAIRMVEKNPEQHILEIGCGTGNTLAYLKQNGFAAYVEGIEKVHECITVDSSVIDKITVTDVENLDFSGNRKFDVVLLLDILEHLREPFLLLERITKLIEPSGYLIVSIPNIRNLSILKQLIINGNWDYQDYGILDRTHLRFFTKKSFLKSIGRAGIKLKVVDYRANYDNYPFWINWMKNFSLMKDFFICQHLFKFLVVDK